VDQFDLTAIYDDYSQRRGAPPYEPSMMVKLIVYGYSEGIRSSRKLERACYEDIGFRVLSANQQPDHWTISNFRRRHAEALGELFVQTVQLASEAGLVKLRHVATDGTRIKANASRSKAMSYAYMKREEERLRQEIEEYFREADRIDNEEDEKYGEDHNGYSLPEGLRTQEERREKIAEAMKRLEERARAKREAEIAEKKAEAKAKGRSYRPRKKAGDAKPKGKDQYNFTDPESRIMRSSDKAFIQGYNAQATVDAETQVVVAAELTNRGYDAPHARMMLDQVEENLARRPKESSMDAGYYSEVTLELHRERGIEPFIPPDKIRHNEWRKQKPPRGRIPKSATAMDLMRRKLRTKRGRECYKLRQTSVEPVFGQIKANMGFRQVNLRGQQKARSMWRLVCAVHNLMKIYRSGVRLEPIGAPI